MVNIYLWDPETDSAIRARDASAMSVGRGGKGGLGASWIFTHDTANVFFNKHSFGENIPTLTNHRSSLQGWLSLSGKGD